jgi:hypothetical protein
MTFRAWQRIVAAALLILAGAIPASSKANKSSDDGFDEGRLDPAWFAGVGEFHATGDLDYLWVHRDFTFDQQRIHFADWPEPVFRGEDADGRDRDDRRLAEQLNAVFPGMWSEAFENAFRDRVTVTADRPTLRVEGRIVDCSTGSAAAKWLVGMGAGAGSIAFDLKFVDVETGELRAAIHHRVVSGTNYSTTDSKLARWIDETVDEFARRGLGAIYARGKKARD